MILCLSNQIMHKYSNLRARIDNDEAYFSSDFCGGEYFVGKYETIHKINNYKSCMDTTVNKEPPEYVHSMHTASRVVVCIILLRIR